MFAMELHSRRKQNQSPVAEAADMGEENSHDESEESKSAYENKEHSSGMSSPSVSLEEEEDEATLVEPEEEVDEDKVESIMFFLMVHKELVLNDGAWALDVDRLCLKILIGSKNYVNIMFDAMRFWVKVYDVLGMKQTKAFAKCLADSMGLTCLKRRVWRLLQRVIGTEKLGLWSLRRWMCVPNLMGKKLAANPAKDSEFLALKPSRSLQPPGSYRPQPSCRES
ncbi:hypothetical protein Cgig2_022165 [Carnegiea gigantea]|uniref:Uncharacterized protein n=1 Tax=Carnegiea gigantea TaxID=171969 RepID=A0A9Q1GSF3_9CARY|nr:hypothetical protein Cgig2_022165 [Carnegiea gigantea]